MGGGPSGLTPFLLWGAHMRKHTLAIVLSLVTAGAFAASTFTDHFNLEKPKDGSTSWGTAIRDSFDTIDSQLYINQQAGSDHLADTVGAHAATAISTTAGTVCNPAATVQAFLSCLDAQLDAIVGGAAVTIDDDQTITGQKTFSQPILGNLIGDVTGNLTGLVNGITPASDADITAIESDIADIESDITGLNAGKIGHGEVAVSDLEVFFELPRTKIASSANNYRVLTNGATGGITDAAAITASRALISDANGIPTHSATTSTELGYVSGVTSAIQTQLDAKTTSAALAAHEADTTSIHGITDTSALVTLTGSQVLTNKTLTSPTLTTPTTDIHSLTDQGSTPATPSAGTTKVYSKTDGKLYKLTSDGSELEVGSGAGGGGINYISANDGAETNTTGWTTYDDAAAAPVDGLSGSVTATWTRTTSSPLRDSGSFLFTKDAANRQGEGVAYPFTIDVADKAKVLQVEFDYSVASGTYASGDLTVYLIQDPSGTPVVIQPAGYQIQSGAVDLPQRHIATFQTASNVTSYALVIHAASTSASAYTVKFDNMSVGPQATTYGAPVTDTTSYTPTLNSNTGISTNEARWWRVGRHMHIRGTIKWNGGGAASVVTVTLPTGYSVDTTELFDSASAFQNFGSWSWYDDSGGTPKGGATVYNSTTSLKFLWDSAASDYFNSTAAANLDRVVYTAVVPIAGWASTVQMSTSTDTRVVAFGGYRSGSSQTVTAGTPLEVVCNTERLDTTDGYSTSTGRYTATVPGWYSFSASAQVQQGATAAATMSAYLRKNGTGDQYGIATLDSLASNKVYMLTSNATLWLNAGDYVSFWAVSTSQNVTVLNTGSTNDVTYFYGERKSGPSQVAASEKIYARYRSSVGQSMANGTTLVDFATKIYDSHGAVTTGASWKFTAPRADVYEVTSSVNSASGGGWAAGEEWSLRVFKNGSGERYLVHNPQLATHSAAVTATGNGFVYLNAGDTIDIRVQQSSGAAINTSTTPDYNWVDIVSQ